MEKQTAVEWFVQQLEESGIDIGNGIKMAYPIPYDIYKEAKAMEKEQIVDAYRNGANDEFEHWMNNEDRITSVGYYKRAYNK